MNYLKISACSLCDGLGVRVVLWVSGCSHCCIGCHNQCSWDENAGNPFTEEVYSRLLEGLNKPYIKGLTFSGGDPLFPSNRGKITEIAKRIKTDLPLKDIWCFTGFNFSEVQHLEIMKYIDYLVDGKFILSQRDVSCAFRGSPNQRIIQVSEGLDVTDAIQNGIYNRYISRI